MTTGQGIAVFIFNTFFTMSNAKKCITVKISNCIQNLIKAFTGNTPARNVILQPPAAAPEIDTPLTYDQYRKSVQLSEMTAPVQRRALTLTVAKEANRISITDPLLYSLTNGQFGYNTQGNDDNTNLLINA